MYTFIKSVLLIGTIALLAGCATGKSAFSKAEKLEQEGNFDEAVLRYADAIQSDPANNTYKIRFITAKSIAARYHLRNGDRFLEGKKYDDALREFQAATALDPSLERARQKSTQVTRMRDSLFFFGEGQEYERGRRPKDALASYRKSLELDPANAEARDALQKLLQSKRPKLEGYELNLKSTKPITLKFKDAKIKDVFNIISQLSGINFIFDEGLKDQNVSVYLENATFLQCLDIICGLNKLGKKVLNESTIIVYPRTPEKLKQYEELMVQTFYLTNLDAKKAVNLLRTMLQLKKVYVNEELNALVIRDTPDVMEVAQKILEANDLQDAEVLLDVEVIEISKKNTENFGLALSSYSIAAGLAKGNTLLSNSLSATDSKAADTASLLAFKFGTPHGFFTVPSATYNFGKTLANGETLQNPRIRVKNKEKSKFNVGQRVPITTTTTANTTTNVNVQYIDVGVKVNAEPTIQVNNEVSLKLSLEVSTILQTETVGDKASLTRVVTIGTRNLDTVLSLKDGETTVIGGLISNSKTDSKNKVFLIGDLPLIGPLLSSNDNRDEKSELVLAITPRIVRTVPIPESEQAGFWSGKEEEPSVRKPYASFTQEPEFADMPSAAPQPPATAPAPAVTPQTPAIAPPPQKAGEVAPAPTPPAPEPPPAPGSLAFVAPSSVMVGEQFTVEIKVADVKNLVAAPFTMVYDPIFADFIGVVPGDFLKQGGKEATFGSSVDPARGTVSISQARVADKEGANGAGTLVKATFKAKNAGPLSLGFQNLNFTGPVGNTLEMVPYNLLIEVK